MFPQQMHHPASKSSSKSSCTTTTCSSFTTTTACELAVSLPNSKNAFDHFESMEWSSIIPMQYNNNSRRKRRRSRCSLAQQQPQSAVELPALLLPLASASTSLSSSEHFICAESSSSKTQSATPAHSRLATAIAAALTLALTRSKASCPTLPATSAAYVALLLLSTACSLCAASPCDTQSWWHSTMEKCIPCTVCEGELIPLRPCQLHRDTICGSIYDLKIDWLVLAKTEPNWKERRKLDDFENEELHEEAIPLDWQTAALFLAVLACLLFFIVAACILINHMRQWRRMERRLDQDVEELSTKLMAKLAEVQSLEGGTFFIGNADALRVPTTFQPQHVLLPAIEKPAKHNLAHHHAHQPQHHQQMQQQQHHHLHHQHHTQQHGERRILKALQPGNVYIEESSSKG